MNRTNINNFLINPDLVANASKEELRRLVETYPYCETLHWIYLRALYIADDAMFDEELMLHGMHISNRRLFYNYLTYQEETDLNSPSVLGGVSEEGGGSQLSILNSQLSTPDYFALEQNQAQKQSLQHLAAQLKAARLARQANTQQKTRDTKYEIQDTTNNCPPVLGERAEPTVLSRMAKNGEEGQDLSTLNSQLSTEKTEENAKKLIKEQKYLEAIEILRAISLNNPKKSANFALQIKFLETIINNHNKN